MVSQLAQANEKYLLIEAGVKANNIFEGIPLLGDLELAMLPSEKQSIVGPAEDNYRAALHVWQGDVIRQASQTANVNPW